MIWIGACADGPSASQFAVRTAEVTVHLTPAANHANLNITFNRKDELQERFVRRVLGGRAGQLRAHMVPSPTAFVDACLLGLGWGMNPELLAGAHLRNKRLVEVVADKWLDVPLYWQQWGLASNSLNALAAALEAQAGKDLRPL